MKTTLCILFACMQLKRQVLLCTYYRRRPSWIWKEAFRKRNLMTTFLEAASNLVIFLKRFKLFVRDKITAKTDQWQAYHKEICCIAPQRFAQGIFFFAGRCPANFNIWHDALLTRRDDVQL